MTTYAIGGQSSGDFRETSARVQLLHVVTRNSIGTLTPDAFTQLNPPSGVAEVSTTLATITKVGVLGGTYAFTRPDSGNGFQGGPPLYTGAASTGAVPLGIFLNDSIGNPYENTPGIASGRGPYVTGWGSCVGNSLYETKVQLSVGGNTAGTAVTYSAGQRLVASINGLATSTLNDAYTLNTSGSFSATKTFEYVGVVKVAPDANSSLLVYDCRI